MPEKYTEKEMEIIDLLLRRLWKRAKEEDGYSFQQIASAVKAKSRVTVWRWYKKTKRTYPSHHHIYHIKKFLGYIKA